MVLIFKKKPLKIIFLLRVKFFSLASAFWGLEEKQATEEINIFQVAILPITCALNQNWLSSS